MKNTLISAIAAATFGLGISITAAQAAPVSAPLKLSESGSSTQFVQHHHHRRHCRTVCRGHGHHRHCRRVCHRG